MTEPGSDADSVAERRGELAAYLAALRSRIDGVCAKAGRNPAALTLIAVTKTFPATDVRLLAGLGIRDVGENRDQEAAPKQRACQGLGLRWHFVGGLQRNKCRSVARYADVVHAVDRPELITALSAAAVAADRSIEALVQVCLDVEQPGGTGRSGAAPEIVGQLGDAIAAAPGLTLAGVMAVAPLGADPEPAFERLAEISSRLQSAHPGATVISAGMSADLDAAIRQGATHLRVGTALLGRRSGLVG